MPGAGLSYLGRRWKGKGRRIEEPARRVAEGSGGTSGVVLDMDMISTGAYEVAYTIPLLIGSARQNLSLQVDTGSSDLWIVSRGCSSSPCDATKGRVYDPSISSISTGKSFTINYLQGNVEGPIVWDTVVLGGYSINNQALAAATTVNAEPLSNDFDGILGLGLPAYSIIGEFIPPVYNNAPDGATFSSNLFGITPTTQAPSYHFISLVLARPGSDRLPSLFSIGTHPSNVVPDPSKVQYAEVVSDSNGEFLWKADVRAITVYVNNVTKSVTLPLGTKGTPFPVAVLDTGVPLILTTSAIANGIYGALGIGPASDGQYYVPCTTPLNMTITLDGRNEIPLHPLDLTTEPADQTNAQYCIGLIQSDDAGLAAVPTAVDMILGVPFMRNTYTVLAYDVPAANGSFPNDTNTDTSNDPAHLRVGLLGLTNSTTALSEFNTVRVLNQPLPSIAPAGGSSGGGGATATVGGHKTSVGIAVLIGLVSFFGLCFALFTLRWFITRRRWAKVANSENAQEAKDGVDAYALTVRASGHEYDPSEATLRTTNSNESKLAFKDRVPSEWTMSTARTHVDDGVDGEFGQRASRRERRDSHNVNDPWDPRNYSMAFRDSIFEPDDSTIRPSSTVLEPPTRPPDHQRTTSELRNTPQAVMMPLLAHTRSESRMDDLTGLSLAHMVGVGTAARGSRIGSDFRQSIVSGHFESRARSISPSGTLRRGSFSALSPRQSAFEDSLSPSTLRPPSVVEEGGGT